MRVGASILVGAVVLAASPAARQQQTPPQSQQQPPPVFRAGVDLVELDVSVFDKDRHPVRGLAAKDFTVLEDSAPKAIEVFAPVDLPDPPPITAEWMKAAPADVDTNDVTSGRLFVIVMDDQNLAGYWIPAIASASRIVESLGPNDLAAVVYTGTNWKGQGFTSDKSRLMDAIRALGPTSADVRSSGARGSVPAPIGGAVAGGAHGRLGPPGPPPCNFLDILREIIDDLKTIPHRRKFVVDISAASTCAPPMLMAGSDGYLITRAQIADINVYSVSPTMLNPVGGQGSFLSYLSESTGAHAIINTNNPEEHVHEIFEENQSYYVLGFVSTNAKDRESLKRIEVKVDRPDVEVRTRTLYNAPKASEAGMEPKPLPKSSAISELVPKSDIALKAGAAAFADASGVNGTVLMVIGVHEPVASDDIEVKGSAFTEDGRPQGSFQQVTAISGEKISGGNPPDILAKGEILARLALKPGRYALRLSAKSRSSDKEGSVYTDVIVPDFSKEAVSLSGLVLTATPGLHAAPRDLAISMIPIVPTAERAFDRTQQLSAFVRVYRAGGDAAEGVTMRVRIVDDHDQVVVDKPSLLPAGAFANRQSADFRLTLPISAWHPGAYLISIAGTRRSKAATREVRVDIR